MKFLKIVSLTLFISTFIFSCNSEKKETIDHSPQTEAIAIANTPKLESTNDENYLYVTAATGLSLRAHANLQSEKLAVMPYGTRVKIINQEGEDTMRIGAINGGMDEIEFNHKKGFAFNGYLSSYFPPEKGISTRSYADELIEIYPEVTFTEETGGTVSKPSNTEIFLLPKAKWYEAYYMAQQLYKIPKTFAFPSETGKPSEVKKEKYQGARSWLSELHIVRNDKGFEKIEYQYKNKRFTKTVTLTQNEKGMVLSKTEIVE
jgi:hypothetical protein